MEHAEPILLHVTVSLPQDAAFEVFVEEIGRWWRPARHSWIDPARAVGLQFERGAGGRLVEFHDLNGDDLVTVAEVCGWVPGESISLTAVALPAGASEQVVDIWFESGDEGTTVTARISVGGPLPDGLATWWENVLDWYRDWAEWGSPRRIGLPDRPAFVLAPDTGLNGDSSLKVNRTVSLGTITIIESVTVGGAPLHVHRDDDEAFYVVDGTMTITLEGETHEVPAGGFAYVPKGTPHAWDTIGEARVLFITAPAGLDEFLLRLHSWPTGYADAWRELAERYGYRLL